MNASRSLRAGVLRAAGGRFQEGQPDPRRNGRRAALHPRRIAEGLDSAAGVVGLRPRRCRGAAGPQQITLDECLHGEVRSVQSTHGAAIAPHGGREHVRTSLGEEFADEPTHISACILRPTGLRVPRGSRWPFSVEATDAARILDRPGLLVECATNEALPFAADWEVVGIKLLKEVDMFFRGNLQRSANTASRVSAARLPHDDPRCSQVNDATFGHDPGYVPGRPGWSVNGQATQGV